MHEIEPCALYNHLEVHMKAGIGKCVTCVVPETLA